MVNTHDTVTWNYSEQGDYLTYHTIAKISANENTINVMLGMNWPSLGTVGQAIVARMKAFTGIASISIEPFRLVLRKKEQADWADIEPHTTAELRRIIRELAPMKIASSK